MARVRKRVYRQKLPDGSTVERKTAKYYGYLAGRPVPLCTDRQASETMLRVLKARLERGGDGIVDPRELSKPIMTHMDEYKDDLALHGSSKEYIRITSLWLTMLVAECDWTTLRSITADSIAA